MAAVSAWSKPGAWALEAEELDEQQQLDNNDKGSASSTDSHHSASANFPSLSAAAKNPKRNPKKQTLTLAEFTTTKFQDDTLLVLPTGPCERSDEELDRSRLGGGFRHSSYNSEGARGGGARGCDEARRERREPRASDSGPSRADEVDDWGATKKSVGVGANSERRERGFFGSSQSKADESDNWSSAKKSYTPPSGEGRREKRGPDFSKEGTNGRSGVDSDNWGKKREERGGTERRRLVLQPRSVLVVTANNGEEARSGSKGGVPFGEARPREEVLKEKGMEWKEIDEKLETVKIQEGAAVERKENGLKEDRTERAWRKPETPPRPETPPWGAEAGGDSTPELPFAQIACERNGKEERERKRGEREGGPGSGFRVLGLGITKLYT